MGRPIYYSSDEDDVPEVPSPREVCRRVRALRHLHQNPFRRTESGPQGRHSRGPNGDAFPESWPGAQLGHMPAEWPSRASRMDRRHFPWRQSAEVTRTDASGRQRSVIYDSQGEEVPDLVTDSDAEPSGENSPQALAPQQPPPPAQQNDVFQVVHSTLVEMMRGSMVDPGLWSMADGRRRLRDLLNIESQWLNTLHPLPPDPTSRSGSFPSQEGPMARDGSLDLWRARLRYQQTRPPNAPPDFLEGIPPDLRRYPGGPLSIPSSVADPGVSDFSME
eukprot:jgi/Botrbrau1/21742/Bobra.43_1s0136.1